MNRVKTLTLVGVLGLAACGGTKGTVDERDGGPMYTGAPPTAPTTDTVELTASDGAPQACLDALDRGDELIDLATDGLSRAADGMKVAGDGFGAVADFDLDALAETTTAIKDIGRWFDNHADEAGRLRDAYDAASAECRQA